MAIISASRRTDIPAFHADRFMEQVREGYFYRVNPYNSRQVSRVSLVPEDVDAIIFWSKNPRPLFPYLDEIDSRGFRYYFHFTLNPYESTFEPGLPPLEDRIATFLELADRIGRKRVVWRYDPIILSTVTPVEWHLERTEELAASLDGGTERVVISFLDFYGKVGRRIDRLRQARGIICADITVEEMRSDLERLAVGMHAAAVERGMGIFSCAEEVDLTSFGIDRGSCIDAGLLRELWGVEGKFPRDRNQRPFCQCAASVDMGAYDSCKFDCVYCYARRGSEKSAVLTG
ncbi:MAG TPA: DUF1848 domain-containing protein [Geobacteraceae bacterium]|nr:DUF1848 domain-containing protein [Geobacteraceae bacterium]